MGIRIVAKVVGTSQRRLVSVCIALSLVGSMSIVLNQSGAWGAGSTPLQINACQLADTSTAVLSPIDLTLSPLNLSGFAQESVTREKNAWVSEPIVTEPVENHVGVSTKPSFVVVDSLANQSLLPYRGIVPQSNPRLFSRGVDEVIETLAFFSNPKARFAYESQVSRVDGTQFLVVGKSKIRVHYLGPSTQISLPNSVYEVDTTMPAAPRLVFFTVRVSSVVATFAIYGGDSLTSNLTSSIVNSGLQRLMAQCQ